MATFRDARLKIKRANEHIAETEKRIEFISTPDGQTSRIELHAEAKVKSVHYHLKRLSHLPELALVIGDAVHNLKTGLDYAWFQTVSALMPRAKIRSKFPIYPSVDQLEVALTVDGIKAATPKLFSLVVREIKPYDGGHFYLRPLHKMDIRDKHELLIPTTNYGNVEGLKVKGNGGAVTGGTWGGELPEEFHVDFADYVEIQNQGRITFSIVFKEGPFKLMEVSGVLKDLSGTVLRIIEILEKLVESFT